MDKIAIILFFLLSDFTLDEYHLARAIAGERPDLVSLDLADRIGYVVLNRLDSDWCPTIQTCVDGGFWGALHVDIPPNWALESARRVLEDWQPTGDFYVFSLADCQKLGLRFADANFWQCTRGWCLAFFGRHTTW